MPTVFICYSSITEWFYDTDYFIGVLFYYRFIQINDMALWTTDINYEDSSIGSEKKRFQKVTIICKDMKVWKPFEDPSYINIYSTYNISVIY